MKVQDTSIYKEFLALKEEVNKHKWYESEKQGRDVGFIWAMMDWTLRYKTKWIQERKKRTKL